LRLLAAIACVPAVAFAVSANAADGLATQKSELASVQSALVVTERRRSELTVEIAALDKDRATINRQLIESSARSREFEAKIARGESRLKELSAQEKDIQASLYDRRGVLAEVLAALQRMGRNPPPALLASPDDTLSSVRSAILLGAVVPEIEQEARILAGQLSELARLRADFANERQKMVVDLADLAQEEARLGLLLNEKKKLSASARQEMAEQGAKAAELAAKTGSLSRLIEDLEAQVAAARAAADAARQAEADRQKAETERLASARKDLADPNFAERQFADPGRLAPAIGFEDAKGLLPRPVAGVELASFGHKAGSGDASQGLSIATRQDSRVVSPADGWIVYAGPFRSYGQLLIVNAGSGYHVLLAGMERIDVEIGQFVLAGEPVAVMGAQRIASAGAIDVDSSRPVLYVEFRKDGHSIDPTPWWNEKTLKREPDDS
jgi:septal ring factor EnvC (AmiA/AmiB activator)